ncbi:Crp/Fnr family transcriptional regulator (plasmid) [Streptomyces sp. NBC_00080]|uniref:Crp/Fnr family transcriptional regulator n=1 Tax=Streptomyces sp. NBC_00080 TaxID=2975645 RepID=UPI002F91084A
MTSVTTAYRLVDLLLSYETVPDDSFVGHLPPSSWQTLLEAAPAIHTYARDELLPMTAEDRYVYIVTRGCVRQDRFPLGAGEGVPTITRFRGVGQFLGEAKLIAPASHVLTRCLSETEVIRWRVRYMNVLHRRRPEVQLALLRSLEDRNRSDELVYSMTTRPPFERVSRLIAHLADIAGVPDPDTAGRTTITGPSQRDMAAALQLGISSVESAIRSLRYQGILDAGYRKFTVLDLEGLRHFTTGA